MEPINIDDEPDQDKRIEKLRIRIEELGGSSATSDEMPVDLEEEFLKQILAYETAESTALCQWLKNAGFELPSPDSLDDAGLSAKLSELIERMASLGTYLLHTNHLSDRGLYEHLYTEVLPQEAILFPENPGYAYMIDLTGSGSEEDNQVYLKYYADDEWRQQWAKDWPHDPMPAHEDLPFDRDRHLPRSPFD